jgi:lambda family phage minor tail protein L
MSIESDVQMLELGSKLYFYELDAELIGGGFAYFHANSDQQMTWQGKVYSPWPIQAEGFAITSQQQPVPTLTVGNIDGSITRLCADYEDLVGTKLIRRCTFFKYLDGQPEADPTQEFTPEVWYIERKSSENRDAVQFELSSPLNFNGVQVPRRVIIANNCPWRYRGEGCGYVGPPVATIEDVPTTNPALDSCSKSKAACKLRQWPDGVLNYGGFPAAGLVRT